jgi:archaellum biogenesis ATPase FlaH
VVLLAGEAGAGAREFLYTSAVFNGLAHADDDLFELHYGNLEPDAEVPGEVHYISFTANETELTQEIEYTMDDEVVEAGLSAVEFVDLSPEFFQLSPVPRNWYAGSHRRITDLGEDEQRRRDLLEAFADYLDANAEGSLVLVDSLTDLVGARREEMMEWSDIVVTLKGLRRAVRSWGGLLLVHVSSESLSDTELGDLMSSVDGTMLFEWETGGNERDRTMVVQEFRGVLSQLEEEDIVRFETEIHEGGFDISNVRKIR